MRLCSGSLWDGALVAAVVLAAAVATTPVSAQGEPIPRSACSLVNPNPTFLSCDQYTEPFVDLFNALPYNEPAYTQCVRRRCVCTEEMASLDGEWTTSGMYCSAAGWNESGAVTCNQMSECFRIYWTCLSDALMERHYDGSIALTPGERSAVDAIIAHGRTPGQSFDVTDLYRSCRMHMCQAAASRRNCGLITCVPNNTQCYEYIKPPPLPDVHQLCTQGCRAMLLVMALTITVFAGAIVCCACCPAIVVENEPLITGKDNGNDGNKKRRRNAGDPDSNFDMASSRSANNEQGSRNGDAERRSN